MKKFLEEFKAFALKGNMLDMAIGVLIGGAFSTLVTSLTDNIINPIIGILFQTDFSDVVLHLPFDINLGIGAFISAVINFIILAFVLFCMLKADPSTLTIHVPLFLFLYSKYEYALLFLS